LQQKANTPKKTGITKNICNKNTQTDIVTGKNAESIEVNNQGKIESTNIHKQTKQYKKVCLIKYS
jgi:hypothetical protein